MTIDIQTANLKEVIMPKAQRPLRMLQKTQKRSGLRDTLLSLDLNLMSCSYYETSFMTLEHNFIIVGQILRYKSVLVLRQVHG